MSKAEICRYQRQSDEVPASQAEGNGEQISSPASGVAVAAGCAGKRALIVEPDAVDALTSRLAILMPNRERGNALRDQGHSEKNRANNLRDSRSGRSHAAMSDRSCYCMRPLFSSRGRQESWWLRPDNQFAADHWLINFSENRTDI